MRALPAPCSAWAGGSRPTPGRCSPGPSSDEWYARAPTFEASLIGRDEEWDALLEAWKDAAKGARRIVLIEGEAGVGKSRLAEEFLRTVVAGGATVLRGRGYDATAGMPFAPIVEALRGALDAPGLAGTDPGVADRGGAAPARAAAAIPRPCRA